MSEFDVEIKDKLGMENLVADHLSRLEHQGVELQEGMEINNYFPEEHLYLINALGKVDAPWFAGFANYLVASPFQGYNFTS